MKDETYEALKRIIEFVKGKKKIVRKVDIDRIELWINGEERKD